jgi:drug/metabolite transporter (DMT)-like permease
MLLGVLLGLGAATAQSLSYLASRWYTAGRGGGMMRLLVLGHALQGAVSLPLTWALWPDELPELTQFLPELVGTAGFYMAGQFGLFVALRYTDASRVSPLLGLKVAILAGVTVAFLGDALSAGQWIAVFVSVAAAFVLNYTGGAIPWPATLALLLTCVGYSLSDLCIRLLIDELEPVPALHAAVWGAAATYVLCGLTTLALLPWYGSRRPRDWVAAAPYAGAWLTAMMFLYTCFGLVGVVFGNILQATRGIISVVLGAGVARLGHVHIERHVPRAIFWRRFAAAAMMFAAIILFVLTKEQP